MAIDLFMVKETRDQKDIEIAVFRKDQLFLKDSQRMGIQKDR